MRPSPKSILLLLATLAALPACALKQDETFTDLFGTGVSLRDLDEVLTAPQTELNAWDYPDIEIGDGRITRMIWMGAGEAGPMAEIIKTLPPVVENKVLVNSGTSFPVQQRYDQGGTLKPVNPIKLEAISLTGVLEEVDLVTEVIEGVLKSIPQIEIGIRVVEVLETDDNALGFNYGFSNTRNDDDGVNLFDEARTALALPGVAAEDRALPLLLDLGTINDGVRIDFLLRALSLFRRTDLLNAPHVRVLDGYSAQITAGQRIPFFTPGFNSAGLTNVTTKFEDVGIKLFITPKVIGRDLVRINLTTAVEAVTGESIFESAQFTISNPIITQRQASTIMDVHDGDTAIIGGLLQRAELSTQEKVPVLGDVPLLSFFFSSRAKTTTQSNLIFFISPRIIDSSAEVRRMVTPVLPAPDGDDAGEDG